MKVSKQLVSKIIANPIHYGLILVKRFEVSVMGLHEPIIAEELFRQAQDVRNGIIGRKMPRNKDNPDFPLRGIKCEGCGKSISGGKTKGKTKYYQYYGCSNTDCPKKGVIKKDEIEKNFTDFLRELTPDAEFLEILKEAIMYAHRTELESVSTSERKINTRIAELKDKKDKLLDLRVEGKLDNEDFMSANEKYKMQIRELEKDRDSLSTPELGLDSVIDSSIEFLKHLPEEWRNLDVKDLRVLRSLLFPENLRYTYPGIKTLILCPIYNIKSQSTIEKDCKVTLQGIEP